jgi:hypothetical protein
MNGAIGGAIQRFTRLESHCNRALSRQIDDFLQANARGAARNEHTIESPAGAQGLANRVDPSHDLRGPLRSFRRRSGLMFRHLIGRVW